MVATARRIAVRDIRNTGSPRSGTTANTSAIIQTLLCIFGSRVHLPESGVLMNNGIMWFDPEAGRPNSLAPGKRCLTVWRKRRNMDCSPTVAAESS